MSVSSIIKSALYSAIVAVIFFALLVGVEALVLDSSPEAADLGQTNILDSGMNGSADVAAPSLDHSVSEDVDKESYSVSPEEFIESEDSLDEFFDLQDDGTLLPGNTTNVGIVIE
jgi:hypothetical protein